MALVSANSARRGLHHVRPGNVSSSDNMPSLLVIVGTDSYKLIVGHVWLNFNLVPSVVVFLLFLFVASLLGVKFREM